MSSRSRSSRIFAERGSTRAHFCEYAGVHGEARWGRAWQGRCRMKSRSDTTPAHSIITKPRDPPTICPPILSPSPPFYALSSVLAMRVHGDEGHNAMTNQRANLQSILNPGSDPILLFPPSVYPPLVLFLSAISVPPLAVLVHRRDCDPSIDPVPGILAMSFQPIAPENVKWMF